MRNDPVIGSGVPRSYQNWAISLDARQTLYAGGAITGFTGASSALFRATSSACMVRPA